MATLRFFFNTYTRSEKETGSGFGIRRSHWDNPGNACEDKSAEEGLRLVGFMYRPECHRLLTGNLLRCLMGASLS